MILRIAVLGGLWVLFDPYHSESFETIEQVDDYLEMMHAKIEGAV